MKKKILICATLVLTICCLISNYAMAVTDDDLKEDIPTNNITFSLLYDKFCKNLGSDKASYIINKHPDTADFSWKNNGSNEDFYQWVISYENNCIQTAGYSKYSKMGSNTRHYIFYDIYGVHKHGEDIQFTVFYDTKGNYIGNVKYDLTNNKTTASSRCPYYVKTYNNVTLE